MKLCKHLEPIYQREIKRNNHLVYLSRWGKYLIVHFKNKLDNYTFLPDVKFQIEKDHHFPFSEQYLCTKCHGSIWGPLEQDQKVRYRRDNFTVFTEKAVANLETIEVQDELWESLNRDIVPKMIGFEDQY